MRPFQISRTGMDFFLIAERNIITEQKRHPKIKKQIVVMYEILIFLTNAYSATETRQVAERMRRIDL